MQASHELEAMNNVLKNQYLQYQQSRESIEIVNQKYHDLKHQIAVLRAETDEARRAAYLDEMERDIKIYDAQNKTGNTVLDTILTSKSLYCQKHGISLNCVADGSLVEFMNVMDQCSLFGNALDNAIESAEKVDDPDKRLILISVSRQKNFVMVRLENYFEQSIEFSEGLPVTTKEEKQFHGYGLKSIRSIAEKYGGSVTVNVENSWFILRVLLPIAAESKQTEER